MSDHLNIRVTGELRRHVNQQIGAGGLYENASEYIRDLIRRDLKSKEQAWAWLKGELEAGLRAPEAEFHSISAEQLIARAKTSAAP